MKSRYRYLILTVALIALVDGALYYRHRAVPATTVPVAAQATHGADFPALYPKSLPVTNGQFDKKGRVINYHTGTENLTYIVTEQPYPDTLIYDKLLTSLNPGDSLTIKQGTINFVKPKDVQSGETVVGHLGDLLMFVHTESSPSTSQWQALFAMMELQS